MKIKSIHAKNMFCFDQLDLEFDLKANNILILGKNYKEGFVSNGSGKSSLINIISQVLMSQTPNSLRQDEIIKLGKDYYYGEVIFDNGKSVKRERKLKTSSSSDPNKELIHRMLGIDNYLDFLNLVYITDAGMDRLFSSRTMTTSDRMGFVSRLYDLDAVDSALELSKQEQRNIKPEISHAKIMYNHIIGELDLIESDYGKDLNQSLSLIEDEILKTSNHIEELELQLAQANEKNNELALKIKFNEDKVNKENNRIKQEIHESPFKFRRRNGSYEKELSDLKEELRKAKNDLRDSHDRISQLTEKNWALECGNCGSYLDIEGNVVDQLPEVDYQEMKRRLGVDINDSECWIADVERRIEEVKWSKKIHNDMLELSVLKKELDELKKDFEPEQNTIVDINSIKQNISMNKSKLLSANRQKGEIERAIKRKNKLLDERKEINKNLSELNNKYEIYDFWAVGFKEIKRRIIQGFLPEFEYYCNKFLGMFDSEFNIKFSTLEEKASGEGMKESFNLSIHDVANNGSRSLRTASLGESKRIILSVFYTLRKIAERRNTNNCKFIMIDEILNNLDSSGIEKFFDLMNIDDYQKIVVSNDSSLADYFDQVITVIAEGHTVRVET